jgi:hypothetical protein
MEALKMAVPVPIGNRHSGVKRSRSAVPIARRELKGNFTTLPNEIYALFEKGLLNHGHQILVALAVLKLTLGAQGRPEYASASYDRVGEMCGGIARSNVSRVMKALHKRGVVELLEKTGCRSLRYKLIPEKWADVLPDDEPEEEEKPEPASRAIGDKVIVRPGGKSPCVAARLAPKDQEPVDFRIECENAGAHPVEFTATIDGDLIQVRICSQEPDSERRKSEFSGPAGPNENSQPIVNNRVADFQKAVNYTTLHFWNRAADKGLIGQVIKAAGAAPVELFQRFVDDKLSPRGAAKKHTPGLLIELARDAARTHQALKEAPAMPRPTIADRPAFQEPPLDSSIAWDRFKAVLKAELGAGPYENWIARTRQMQATADSIYVAVPDQGTRDYLKSEFSDVLEKIRRQLNDLREIEWRVEA